MIGARLKQWLQAGTGAAGGPVARPDAAQVRVLMVCMGNICRSPTAEGVLRAKLQQAGLQQRVWVDSAGTHGYHTGEAPDPRAIAAAARRGYDLSRLKARPVGEADFGRFHWLLAMDEANRAWLHKRLAAGFRSAEASPPRPAPPPAPELALLMQFAGHNPGVVEVPDPYYGGPAGFERVLDLVEDACEGFVAHLSAGLDAGSPLPPVQV